MDSFNSSIDISLNCTFDSFLSENIEEKPSTNSFIDRIMMYYLRHNLTLVALEDCMKLLNENRNDCDKLPTRKKQIIQLFLEHRDLVEIIYFVQCDKCQKNTKVDSKNTKNMECEYCHSILKTSERNFFVYMPIEKQILKSIEYNWSHICKFDTTGDKTSYSDAHDGAILKNILKLYADSDINILSLCLNIDGANKFKSNTLSVWPIQLLQNYLPPEIRFQPHNIIVAGLCYCDSDYKLNCREFLQPLAKELKQLAVNNIKINIENVDYTFMPVITHCAVDLPAKSKLQETKQCGGYDACTYCDIHGEQIEIENSKGKKRNKNSKGKKSNEDSTSKKSNKFVRYVEGDETHKLRNEVETLEKMLTTSTSRSMEPVDGIKDVSCLVGLKHFNIVFSIGVEYMHCVLQGVTKRLLNLFLNSKNSDKAFYITQKKRKILNARILAIKPNANVVRKPRSLEKRSNFKASEYRFLLLFYLPVCLPGCVPNVYVDHVRLLSAAVYILLKARIFYDEVDEAEKMSNTFVTQHQDLFGKASMVMVVHLLKHLAESVRQLGPLWCHSAFPFERNNGSLLKLVNGTSDVLHQMSTKYALKKSIIKTEEKANIDNKILLGKGIDFVETSSDVLSVDSLKTINFSNVALCVHKRIKIGETIYTSLMYTRPKRSIDYFIGLKNGMVGMAKYYFDYEGEVYVMMKTFEIGDSISHIFRVHPTNKNIMAPISKIDVKYVYMRVGLQQYIVSTPNPYEKE